MRVKISVSLPAEWQKGIVADFRIPPPSDVVCVYRIELRRNPKKDVTADMIEAKLETIDT
jgi:hypothetical protein